MKKEDLEDFLDKGMSYLEISRHTGVPKPTVAWNIKKFGLNPARKFKEPSKEVLEDLYINQKMSLKSISKKIGIWEKSVLFWINRYGIETRPLGTNQFSFCEKKINQKREKVSKAHSLEDVKKFVESKNCTLIENFIQKGKTRIKYICHCNSPHEMYMCNFKKGYPCKECKRRKFQGKNNHNYNPNLSEYDRLELGRYEEGYKAWRIYIYKKYDYTCDICRKLGDNDLNAHHLESYIENPDLRTDINNGVCLCENCHKEFHSLYGFGKNTRKQYEEFKLKKGFSDGRTHI